jgi:hypothetical protein
MDPMGYGFISSLHMENHGFWQFWDTFFGDIERIMPIIRPDFTGHLPQ